MPFSPFDPHLSERDAHLLCTKVTESLQALGHLPSSIGVHLDYDGFYFTATMAGKTVTVRTGQQQNVRYDAIARELVLLAKEPTDRGLEIDRILTPGVTL